MGESPRPHEHQFVNIVDNEEIGVAQWVCSAYHYDRYVARLDHGHTFPLSGNARLRDFGHAGTLVIEGGFLRHFAEPSATIAGITTNLFAVVPLTDAELAVKRAHGLDAVFEEWERTKRDTLQLETIKPH